MFMEALGMFPFKGLSVCSDLSHFFRKKSFFFFIYVIRVKFSVWLLVLSIYRKHYLYSFLPLFSFLEHRN